MPDTALLAPVIIQALLTFAILIMLGPARSKSMRETRTRMSDPGLALGTSPWNDHATRVSNNFKNQFEMPVLFYAVCAFTILARRVDLLMVGLAWAFVATRLVHAFIHLTNNVVRIRALLFFAGALILLAMWLVLAFRVFAA